MRRNDRLPRCCFRVEIIFHARMPQLEPFSHWSALGDLPEEQGHGGQQNGSRAALLYLCYTGRRHPRRQPCPAGGPAPRSSLVVFVVFVLHWAPALLRGRFLHSYGKESRVGPRKTGGSGLSRFNNETNRAGYAALNFSRGGPITRFLAQKRQTASLLFSRRNNFSRADAPT